MPTSQSPLSQVYFTALVNRPVGWRPADGSELVYWAAREDAVALGLLLELLTRTTSNAEAASLLGISERTVCRLLLPSHVVGRHMKARRDASALALYKQEKRRLKRSLDRAPRVDIGDSLELRTLPDGQRVAQKFGSRPWRGERCWDPSKLKKQTHGLGLTRGGS